MNVLIAYTPKFEGAANRIESLAREYGVEASIVALENSGSSSPGGMVHEIAPEITSGLVIALTEYSTCVIDLPARVRVLKLSYSGAGGFRGRWRFNPYNPAAWLQEAHSYLVECEVPLLGSLLALLTMAAGVVSLTLLKSDIWRSCEVVGNSLELWQSCSGRRDTRDRLKSAGERNFAA